MAALTQPTARKRRDLHLATKGYGTVKTAVTIQQGALVSLDEATGNVTNAAAATGLSDVLGVATATKTATETVEYLFGHQEFFTDAAALTKGYTTCNVGVSDNDTVTTLSDAGTAAVQVRVGELTEWTSSGSWVAIRRHSTKSAP